jgi:RNA polymerase sigma-70 factor, ECF subfamily
VKAAALRCPSEDDSKVPDDAINAADEDLVRRVRAGDERAAALLYGRYEGLLRGQARRRLLGGMRRKVAESDIVQETYLAAFRDLDDFEDRGPGSFRRWLETILSYRANENVRRFVGADKRALGREVSTAPDGSGIGPASPGLSPSVEVAAKEERETLRHGIDAMEGDDRLVLRLIGLEGKDFCEAGQVLNRSPDAARKLYARAVLRLAKQTRGAT